MRKLSGLLIVLLFGCCLGRAATTLFYDDPAQWANALKGSPTTVNFEGIVPPDEYLYIGTGAGTNTDVGGVNFAVGPTSDGFLFIIGDDFYYPGQAVISSQGSDTPYNELLITLPVPETALGFYFGDFGGDTATITLSNGAVAYPTAMVLPYLGFFGMTSSVGIDSVDISTPNQVMNVGPFSYGTAMTAEPGAAILLAAAGLLMGLLLRKRAHARAD